MPAGILRETRPAVWLGFPQIRSVHRPSYGFLFVAREATATYGHKDWTTDNYRLPAEPLPFAG